MALDSQVRTYAIKRQDSKKSMDQGLDNLAMTSQPEGYVPNLTQATFNFLDGYTGANSKV